MIPATNGATCPGGMSYAGAGYCKARETGSLIVLMESLNPLRSNA